MWQKEAPYSDNKMALTGPPNPEDQAFGQFCMIPTASFVQKFISGNTALMKTVHTSAITLLADSM
jgi:hypothetical protein